MATIRHTPRPARTVLAALSLAALSTVAACSAGGDGGDGNGTTGSTTGPEPTPSLATTPAGATGSAVSATPTVPGTIQAVAGWTDAGADPDVFGTATVTDAVVVDQRLVAVGCRPEGATGDLPIWTTTDATTWQPVTGPETAAGDTALGCLTDVVATPVGLFAHGQALLRSVDGTAWTEVTILGPAGQRLGSIDAVFPRAGGVAVLTQRASLNESTEAQLWTSTDGLTFTEEPVALADVFDNADVSQVLAVGSGLIAVGASPWGEFEPTAAVWASDDGLRWRIVTPTGDGFRQAFVQAAVPAGTGFVAVGGDPFATSLLAAWTGSADGLTWRRLPAPEETTRPDVAYQEALAVTVVDGTIHAAGHDYDARRPPGDQDRAVLWTSLDGTTFGPADPSPPAQALPFTITRFGDRQVGFWPPPRWLDPGPVQVLTAPAAG